MLNKLHTAICAQVNPRGGKAASLSGQQKGLSPSKHWELDLIEFTPTRFGYQYLLDLVDTFSKWVEAFSPGQK